MIAAHRAEIAAALGDREAAVAAYRQLLPHADLHVTGGAGVLGTGGSTHYYLGVAAAGFGQTDTAIDHLRASVTANLAAGLPPFAAEARCRLAEILTERGHPEDRDEAADLADAAQSTAGRIGMAFVAARALAVLEKLRAGGAGNRLSRREHEIAALVAQGLTNRQIAATVHISERTAENHVQHILTKLGFSTRSQIAAWATARRLGAP